MPRSSQLERPSGWVEMMISSAPLSTMKKPRPTHFPPTTAAITITPKYAIDAIRNLNASASLRRGLIIASEQVDGRVDHDPHYVDEVPVDPADLDAVVVLGGEMPAEGADGHEQQNRQPDEDVRAVEAGQAIED